jgi:hypothetical protein
MRRAIAALVTVAIGGAMLAGCSSGARVTQLDGHRSYPGDKVQSEVLDVQLLRDGPEVSLTNTSATAFGETTIWLNQEFSYVVDGIGVGETIRVDLGAFRNQYGKPFRAGGFFATQRPKNVVLAQLEPGDDAQSLLGIVVVDGRAFR